MVILEIDGQKYGGQSYVEAPDPTGRRDDIMKLAVEIAETVFIHYGYGVEDLKIVAVLNEGEQNDEQAN